MPRCSGSKPDGTPCERIVPGSFCYSHDPARADERRRAASKAGRSKPNRNVADIKRRLSDLADDVLNGSLDKGVGAVVSQILNVYLRAISVELKVTEQTELTERLEELEAALKHKNERGRRGYA